MAQHMETGNTTGIEGAAQHLTQLNKKKKNVIFLSFSWGKMIHVLNSVQGISTLLDEVQLPDYSTSVQ